MKGYPSGSGVVVKVGEGVIREKNVGEGKGVAVGRGVLVTVGSMVWVDVQVGCKKMVGMGVSRVIFAGRVGGG